MNKVHLESARPAADPTWRVELLTQGLVLVRRLLEHPSSQIKLPLQATIALQSGEGEADTDIDLATGAVHLYAVRAARDDAAADVERFDQPVLVMTAPS